jgi:polynucleotide 5'-kinase involved in rRNA processing
MVAINKMAGNELKSSGLELLMAIIIMIRPITILNVNRKSSKNAGRGSTSMEIISRTRKGIPNPESSIFDRSCRRFDSVAIAI